MTAFAPHADDTVQMAQLRSLLPRQSDFDKSSNSGESLIPNWCSILFLSIEWGSMNLNPFSSKIAIDNSSYAGHFTNKRSARSS
jgi:hypothetical protein